MLKLLLLSLILDIQSMYNLSLLIFNEQKITVCNDRQKIHAL